MSIALDSSKILTHGLDPYEGVSSPFASVLAWSPIMKTMGHFFQHFHRPVAHIAHPARPIPPLPSGTRGALWAAPVRAPDLPVSKGQLPGIRHKPASTHPRG